MYDYFEEPNKGAEWSIRYRDVPAEFRLGAAWDTIQGMYDLLDAEKDNLIRGFELHYNRYEINGSTYQDFNDLLAETLFNKGDILEGMLEVYDRLDRPRTSKTEVTDTEASESGASDGVTSTVDVPADAPEDDKDTSRGKVAQTSTVARNERVTRVIDDYGFDANHEILNEYTRNGRTKYELFNAMFEDCFLYSEAWYKW